MTAYVPFEPDRGPMGSTLAEIAVHYDIPAAAFAQFLTPEMDYCAGLWRTDHDELDVAHAQNLSWFLAGVDLTGRSVLDIGCGWGSAIQRMVRQSPTLRAVGLTLSAEQAQYARSRLADSPVDILQSSWEQADLPPSSFDVAICFGAFEHFARRDTSKTERLAGYGSFFERVARWLRPGGRFGLQTSVLTPSAAALEHLATPATRELEFVFPGARPPTLGEVEVAAAPWLEVVAHRLEGTDYVRTYRCWYSRAMERSAELENAIGRQGFDQLKRYFGAVIAVFRTGHWQLLRVVMQRPEDGEFPRPVREHGVAATFARGSGAALEPGSKECV